MSNKVPYPCKVCGIDALYFHYGVKACSSCKVFFKRYAENRAKTFNCDFNGQCEVNINTRHICTACRLAKCFDVGMSVELIRSARVKKIKPEKKIFQIRTLNLVSQDQSLLNQDQWTYLSNLIHSYDEHNALCAAENFHKELNSLHPKQRIKVDSRRITELATVFYQATEPFVRSNRDMYSLSSNDRAIVLRGAIDNVSCLGGGFLLRQSGLTSNPSFRNILEKTYGSIPYRFTLTAISLLDDDINIVKLTFSLFAFCVSSCTIFNENNSSAYLRDIRSVLRIQNSYAELIWKYLLYTDSFKQAVRRFTSLIQCMMAALTVRAHLQSLKDHTEAVESLSQRLSNISD